MPTTTGPLVSALLVTGADQRRAGFAQVAVQAFLRQTYLNAELVVAHAGELPLDLSGHHNIRVHALSSQAITVPQALRGAAKQARGDWLIRWDDDDYHHRHRIAVQMAHRYPGYGQLLRSTVRADIVNSDVWVCAREAGDPATALVPASAPAIFDHADAEMPEELGHVLDNDALTSIGPSLCIRLHTGINRTDVETFLSGKTRDLYEDEAVYLQNLGEYPGVTPRMERAEETE